MQGGVGVQVSTAADGLPLPTCVVAGLTLTVTLTP